MDGFDTLSKMKLIVTTNGPPLPGRPDRKIEMVPLGEECTVPVAQKIYDYFLNYF